MNKLNLVRVVAGGVLAGIILVVGEYVLNAFVVAEEWAAFDEQRGFPEEGSAMIVMYIVMNLLVGILLVLLYALIRPRSGAGPATAILAGLYVWVILWLIGFGSSIVWLGVPSNLIVIVLIWGLAEVLLAALAGGWAYQESE
jgi:hypothetical protein